MITDVWIEPLSYLILHEIKVIFSDESGHNSTLVKPTQYDGRSYVKSG